MRLDERIPDHGFASPDDALLAFLDWAGEQGTAPWPHQEEAFLELFAGRHVVLDTPTGSGKSLVALALHFKTFAQAGFSVYTAPIKALVSEKFFALCRIFGPEHVGMMTGDGGINPGAPILCCTAEILADRALREGHRARLDAVVMDEFHYYGDRDRGMAWQIPLLRLPQAQFLLMSGTLGDTTAIRQDLEARSQRAVSLVQSATRPVPLEFRYSRVPLHESIDQLVRGGQAPVYVVHFTQREATEQAQALTSRSFCTKEEKAALAQAIGAFRFESPFGGAMRRFLFQGIGLHHAGLLPRYRLLVEKLAQQGLLKVICGTDTLGVGINVPIRTVLFTQLCKFDGEKVEHLRRRDFQQIAGRAGRAGFDRQGLVVVQAPAHVIENARIEAQAAETGRKKKVVKAQPPQRGYKHWDEETFRQLVELPPERLESRFAVDHGKLLTLMQQAEAEGEGAARGVEELRALVRGSHASEADKRRLEAQIDRLLEGLLRAEIALQRGGELRLAPGLDTDFRLHHGLSLFLVEATAELDRQAADYPLRLLSWVEAILESPKAILQRQADRERGRRVAELKAQGVPYEERMEALEEVSWPKPLAEEIYALFNAWQAHHPWVDGEAVGPKAIAREIVEELRLFADYVKELGVERSEGVLLRYLSDVVRVLGRNLPPDRRTEPVEEALQWLHAMVHRVDASLLTEWESLVQQAREVGVPVTVEAVDISRDRAAFQRRLRAEAQALVRALALGEWEEALAALCPDPELDWTAEALRRAVEPLVEEGGGIAIDARARQPFLCRIEALGPHQWRLRQGLLPARPPPDEDEELAWEMVARVDLREDRNPSGPLLRLLAIQG